MLEFTRGSVFLLASFALLLMSTVETTAGNAQSPYQPGVGFAMIGMATGQTVRLHALNLGTGSSASDPRCNVTLQFLDANGQVLKQAVPTIRPGKAAYLDLRGDSAELAQNDVRVPFRAVLLYGYFGGAPPGPGGLQAFDCNIVPSLEIFDTETKQTSVVLTATTPLPPPATAAQ